MPLESICTSQAPQAIARSIHAHPASQCADQPLGERSTTIENGSAGAEATAGADL